MFHYETSSDFITKRVVMAMSVGDCNDCNGATHTVILDMAIVGARDPVAEHLALTGDMINGVTFYILRFLYFYILRLLSLV